MLIWHPLVGDPVEVPLFEHGELPTGIGELRLLTRESPAPSWARPSREDTASDAPNQCTGGAE